MSKRQSIIQYDSAEVQGEGSWVKVRLISHGESKHLTLQYGGLIGKDMQEIGVDRVLEMQRTNDDLLVRNIVDWNWVDDDDNPLPVPHDDPSVMDQLTEFEHKFLADALKGEGERKK